MVASPAILPGVHGGPDALGVPAHDFSTNSNACGPCPAALAALQQADATRYPDPAYTALRAALAALHGVAPDRIVVAGSASEFIHRITTWARLHGCTQVLLPPHSYGDYAQAAQAHGLAVLRRSAKAAVGGEGSDAVTPATLHWACEPASPLGTVDGVLSAWQREGAGLRLPPAAACNISLRPRAARIRLATVVAQQIPGPDGRACCLRRGPCRRREHSAGAARPGGILARGRTWRGLVGGLGHTGRAAMGGRLPAHPAQLERPANGPVYPTGLVRGARQPGQLLCRHLAHSTVRG